MPKRAFDEDTHALEDVSVLFIPFEANGSHFRRNAGNGVEGVFGTVDTTGRPVPLDPVDFQAFLGQPRGPLVPSAQALDKGDIAARLNAIIEQECELVRKMHHPDETKMTFAEFVAVIRNEGTLDRWSKRQRQRVESALRGDKHYPTLIFLSENPTGAPFVDRLEIQSTGMGYVKEFALDASTVPGIANVNEMAVYLREDIHQRIVSSAGSRDALFLRAEYLKREVLGSDLYKPTKDEFMLKVTLGRAAGYSFSVAGVHLRATLTGAKTEDLWREERDALQAFCEAQGIQLLVGDFNMDLHGASAGGRGVFFDSTPEHNPVFMMQQTTGPAFPRYQQQFSSSNNKSHYMGYYQADTTDLSLTGPGMYGSMGASYSRSIGDAYYSDHPSIYVQVRSERLTSAARQEILNRKIVKVLRPKRLGS
ncbi:hypothetical protein [Melittangium boletus]|uniref:hypothetical protein n=1 Tax=Melittangium boletus TaxID=83453 RepID=UPI003DA4A5E8